jgi:hypothetical protein
MAKRPIVLEIRLHEAEHQQLAQAAGGQQMPLSTWARWVLLKAAQASREWQGGSSMMDSGRI